MWQNQIETLSDFADITIGDLTKSKSIHGMAKDVLEVASNKFSLVGFSLGGIVALEIMRIAPERVKRLALISSNPYPPKKEQQKTWNNLMDLINEGEFSKITKNKLLPVLISDKNRTEGLEKHIIAMSENIGPSAYMNQLNAVSTREDQRPILEKITCPTTLIVGEDDLVCPIELTNFMQGKIDDVTKVIVKNAGHMVTLEQPESVSNALKEWLIG